MPKITITHESELKTRNDYTRVDGELLLRLDGKEFPSTAVLGAALDEAWTLIQTRIADSYKIVPPRV